MLGSALSIAAFFILSAFASPFVVREATAGKSSASLAELALQQILDTASPIFGVYDHNATATNTSTWMRSYPDSTLLVHMNIPGTHDSSTWNYSQATQDSLLHITEVDGVTPSPAAIYRCQERSYFDMLNAGIRAFDIRYSFDATNSSLVVYHSAALQSETALLLDIMFGFYQWLDDHPSETLLLSFSKSRHLLCPHICQSACFALALLLFPIYTLTPPLIPRLFYSLSGHGQDYPPLLTLLAL
jgi:1-phosphatidylinositol phosphodiesterase